jgi:hypothetical protein
VETPVEGGKADPEAEKNPKEVVILIGDAIREESEDGKEGTVVGFYAKPENGDAVYRLDSEPVNALFLKHEADFFTTLYSKVLQSNVETLDVMMGGEKKISYRFDRHPGKDDDGKDITVTDFYMNDTAVDSGYVNGVYYKFGRLAYDRVLTEKDKIPEKYEPDLEMIYHTNLEHFEEITVGYMKYDSNYDIVYLNGEPKALINFREVEGLEKDLDEALQTLEKLRESATDTTEGV